MNTFIRGIRHITIHITYIYIHALVENATYSQALVANSWDEVKVVLLLAITIIQYRSCDMIQSVIQELIATPQSNSEYNSSKK